MSDMFLKLPPNERVAFQLACDDKGLHREDFEVGIALAGTTQQPSPGRVISIRGATAGRTREYAAGEGDDWVKNFCFDVDEAEFFVPVGDVNRDVPRG